MRAFAFIFAIYLSVLACLTCADEVARPEPKQAQLTAATHPYGSNDAPSDWCSPLCQCHCCPGVTLPVATLGPLVTLITEHVSTPTASLRVTVPSRAPGSLWQPPRA
ncbi:DUF6660 family protein [Hymenobacter coalescens]